MLGDPSVTELLSSPIELFIFRPNVTKLPRLALYLLVSWTGSYFMVVLPQLPNRHWLYTPEASCPILLVSVVTHPPRPLLPLLNMNKFEIHSLERDKYLNFFYYWLICFVVFYMW